MKNVKRQRELTENCPRCGSKFGEACTNCKGKRKSPCKVAVTPDIRHPTERPPTQQELFAFFEEGERHGEP